MALVRDTDPNNPVVLTERGRDTLLLSDHHSHHANADETSMSVRTTVRINRIPRKYTLWDLEAELDHFIGGITGFVGKAYDFLYLPLERHRGQCRGHAFVNMRSPELAIRLFEVLHGASWTFSDGDVKNAFLDWSFNQGFLDILLHCLTKTGSARPPVVGESVYVCDDSLARNGLSRECIEGLLMSTYNYHPQRIIYKN
jgi:hypothetical protein